ncbi:MAG TPA: CGNR zinc finger domain-containing protein [Gemmatimonadaceae bacterium]|nr:CGNR zinc finger domain-containing protein [Gemmatimonadaceae bacterium]
MRQTKTDGPADASPRTIGGHIALDFSNTVAWRLRDTREERLPSYAALVTWAREAGTLGLAQAQQLLRTAARQPRPALAALRRARALREAIFDIGGALGRHHTPSDASVAAVHAAHLSALRGARLSWNGIHCDVTWDERHADLDRPWWPVALAAAELLASNELRRVRMCAGVGCGWLFLDESRNNSRRWCASGDCGNRARVDQFRMRQQQAAQG